MTAAALDLFAGTGWGVACRRLGIEEYGVEIMPEARAVRELNGMRTIYGDVWEGLSREHGTPEYDLLIASPPCQTFSMAGSGAGRKALDEVLAAIDALLYLDPAALVEFGETHDPKTALVLAPLAHIARDTPTFVVLEQVPPILPVWERCAEEMRRWGYSVWTGNLQAEMYGVPQTRKRAILIARADGKEAKAPAPTHSRYYSRDPQRLDEGVLPWVSMAEALGWGMTERPMATAGNAVGRAEGVGGSGGKAAIEREKSRGAWLRSNYGTGGDPAARGERSGDEPAPTVTSKADRNQWVHERPASTLVGTRRSEGGMLVGRQLGGDDRRDVGCKPGGVGLKPSDLPAERVTVAEAAALQSYPADFRWDATLPSGKPITKTNTFLQIGNAVPPKLAEAILREVLS